MHLYYNYAKISTTGGSYIFLSSLIMLTCTKGQYFTFTSFWEIKYKVYTSTVVLLFFFSLFTQRLFLEKPGSLKFWFTTHPSIPHFLSIFFNLYNIHIYIYSIYNCEVCFCVCTKKSKKRYVFISQSVQGLVLLLQVEKWKNLHQEWSTVLIAQKGFCSYLYS